MDARVEKLKSVEECERFARNARDRGYPGLAQEAQARTVQLKSETHEARSQVERECLQAVYAYEEAQSKLKGRRFHANRTWQMIKRHGIIPAVERAVNRSDETMGYQTLVEMGMGEFAFERVILRHPSSFSDAAVLRARERLDSGDSNRITSSEWSCNEKFP